MRRRIPLTMLLIVFCCLAFFSVAHAEQLVPITEIRRQADGGWKETYEAHGRTIEVDIPITVPQVDSVPVVICEDWKRFDKAWIASQLPSPISTTHEEHYTELIYPFPVQEPAEWKEEKMSIIVDDVLVSMSVNNVGIRMDQLHSDNLKRICRQFYPHELDLTKPCAEDNPMTVEEAAGFMSALLNWLYGEDVPFTIHWIDTFSRGRIVKGDSDEGEGQIAPYYPPGEIMLECDQTFRGIPNIQRVWELMTAAQGVSGTLIDVKAERLGLNITDRDSWTFGASLKKEKEVVAPDIPLVGAQTIIDQLEEMILAGKIRDVYSLELGYYMFMDPQTDGQYWLYPVWKCECLYVKDKKKEVWTLESVYTSEAYRNNSDNFKWFVFNAQTGELIGKEKGATAEDFYCPPIIQ